jgi:hypothetical protein
MATEEEETRGSIADTIAQLGSNYKVAEGEAERADIDKQAKDFIKSVAKGEDEIKEYTDMYNEIKG